MSLSVRSQDKEILAKYEHFSVEKNISDDWVIIGDNGIRVINHLINDDKTVITADELGTYKTKERALEVLDEIQNYIVEKNVISNCNSLLTLANNKSLNEIEEILTKIEKISVYEMPKE